MLTEGRARNAPSHSDGNGAPPPRPHRAPPGWVLVGLLLAAFLPPFVARAMGTGIGAFSMFTHLEQYHLDIAVRTESGEERVPLESLAPHLSRDAGQVVLPAAGHAFGEEQIDDLASGLPDIGALVCALHPAASSARARLSRGPIHGVDRVSSDVTVRCSGGE